MIKDIYNELMSFLKGKTLDALIPTALFIFLSQSSSTKFASSIAIIVALILLFIRLLQKQKWQYAFGGFIGVVIASSFAFVMNTTKGFFYPKLISNALTFLICLVSLLLKKPLAAWISHLTRGWSREWFWRKDILPAYSEVTFIWLIFLFLRLILLVLVLNINNITLIFILNLVLGTPTTIAILILSYIYGIWRLQRLRGPSVDEFISKSPKPWKGQKKGF